MRLCLGMSVLVSIFRSFLHSVSWIPQVVWVYYVVSLSLSHPGPILKAAFYTANSRSMFVFVWPVFISLTVTRIGTNFLTMWQLTSILPSLRFLLVILTLFLIALLTAEVLILMTHPMKVQLRSLAFLIPAVVSIYGSTFTLPELLLPGLDGMASVSSILIWLAARTYGLHLFHLVTFSHVHSQIIVVCCCVSISRTLSLSDRVYGNLMFQCWEKMPITS